MAENTRLLQTLPPELTEPATLLQDCDGLRNAINEGKIGDIVANHEKMILHYYEDVQDQAKQSFNSAKIVAGLGFVVLVCTLIYKLVIDALIHSGKIEPTMSDARLTVGEVGLLSGFLIEFIAGINFLLYARVAKQFNAFHICLERTHRYLLGYKIAEQIEMNRDETLRDLVCIMANAPMITRDDIDSVTSVGNRPKSAT